MQKYAKNMQFMSNYVRVYNAHNYANYAPGTLPLRLKLIEAGPQPGPAGPVTGDESPASVPGVLVNCLPLKSAQYHDSSIKTVMRRGGQLA